jgi:hypothetical protein
MLSDGPVGPSDCNENVQLNINADLSYLRLAQVALPIFSFGPSASK